MNIRILLLALILLTASPAWARVPTPFFPTGTTSKTTIGFSWDAAPTDYSYFLQIQDTTTGAIVFGDYVHQSTWAVTLYPGAFSWRVEALSDASTHGGFTDWEDFTIVSSPPAVEDLLGLSPIASVPPLRAQLRFPSASWRAADGSLLIADTQHSVIKRLAGGVVSVIAGDGIQGYSGNGLATQVELNQPTFAADDGAGNIYIFDAGNYLVRKLTPDGALTTVAGVPGQFGYLTSDKNLQDARIGYVAAVAVRQGVIYVAMNFVQRWQNSPGYVDVASVFTFNGSTFAPYAPLAGLSFIDITGFDTLDGTDWVIDDGSLYEIVAGVANNVAANMATPDGVMATGPSTAFVGDSQNIIKYSQGSRTVAADDFVHVSGIEAEPNGSLLITDSDNQQVLDFDLSTKTRSAIVDGSTLPFGSITQVARLDANHLAVLTSNPGGIYSYDLTTGATIRLAGNGYHDPSIAGPADRTSLYFPSGLAVDALGDCFWAESNAIYQYTAQTGRLSVLTGTPFQPGYRDNTDLADATFNAPGGMAVDAAGNLIVADTGNNAVRLINPHSDWVTTIAALNAPMGVGPYGDGVYVSSYLANDIQFCFYNTGDGVGCSVAAGVPDFQHVQGQGKFQDGPRLEARFNSPNGLNPIAGQADLVVADQFNQRVRRVNSNASTIVGDGQEGYGPNQLNLPTSALVLDGRVYIADTGNGLLRVIALP